MSRQWTLPLQISGFKAADYGKLARVFGPIFPDYDRTPEEWRFEDESLDRSKFHFKRYSCISRDVQEPVGFAQCQHIPWMYHPRMLWFDIWVDPQHQRKGIGSALYERLNQDFKDLGTVTSWTGLKEDMPYPIKFATNRGFHEKMRAWESRLNPATVNLSAFQKYVEKAYQQRIRLVTLANEMKSDPQCYTKLHALVQSVSEDIPRPEQFTPVSFEQWSAFEMKNPNLDPEGYMIAKDGDKYVGMSTVWKAQKESQRTLSGTYRSNSRIPGTGNSGRVEAQSHRIRKRQQVREAQDLERLDQRTHARNQHQARLQTRSRLDNPGEEPGLDPE